ncbi:alanine-tRNA ligase [Wolffia australiana]
MAAEAEEAGVSPRRNQEEEMPKGVLEELPWLDYAIDRVQFVQGTIDETYETVRRRISEIGRTSSAHLQQSVANLEENFGVARENYALYEALVFGKLKEGILISASHPTIAAGAVAFLGILALKRPRRYLIRNTLRLFVSKESSLSSAQAKATLLRQSIDVTKLERQKLEERALMAKNQMEWGKKELRKTSSQIQGIVHSIYNIERQARGLKSVLQQYPRRQTAQILSKVSSLPYEVQRERKSLHAMLSRICDHRI